MSNRKAAQAQADLFSFVAARAELPPGRDFRLSGHRLLAQTWRLRAADNIAAMKLAQTIEAQGRRATANEQELLIRFIGFGASDICNNLLPGPGVPVRAGWESLADELSRIVGKAERDGILRSTQYAHYTPEVLVRAVWDGAQRMGFTGGRVIEPGCGSGMFMAMAPPGCAFTGVEADPVTARIVRLLQPSADIRGEDFTHAVLPGGFDLAIGNPPFQNRAVRHDTLPFSLHDFFIARSVELLRPGALAAFVVSRWTLDKLDATARLHIGKSADLVWAIRLPKSAMAADAGTDVVVDLLFFRKRLAGDVLGGQAWTRATEIEATDTMKGGKTPTPINEFFALHRPDMVLGENAITSGQYGPTYTVLPSATEGLPEALARAFRSFPGAIPAAPPKPDAPPAPTPPPAPRPTVRVRIGTAASGARIKEGSYILSDTGALCQVVDGQVALVETVSKAGATVIRGLIPIREAVRDVLRAQEADRPSKTEQLVLTRVYKMFTAKHGPINRAIIVKVPDKKTGEIKEWVRRPNLSPFRDDPDCWLVASIEEYDSHSGQAAMGPIFTRRVIHPPPVATIASPTDALAVCLNERGKVDLPRIAEMLETDEAMAAARLGDTVFRNPAAGWETADDYLSGPVRTKLLAAVQAAEKDPAYQRNAEALSRVQPFDIQPSDITVRLGVPWLPVQDVEMFIREQIGVRTKVFHNVDIAAWTVQQHPFRDHAASKTLWGTHSFHAGALIEITLNSKSPKVYKTVTGPDGKPRQEIDAKETEAATAMQAKLNEAFTDWVWTDSERAGRLSRIYNDRYNNLVSRHFDGRHLLLPGASHAVQLRPHQKDAVWRIIASGDTYLAHCVGSGKTKIIAAAIMEQRRLGLISKPIIVVPGHTLIQWAREFLELYPNANILVADENNFVKEHRQRFIARAATGAWDAIIITHHAFKHIAVPQDFERRMVQDEIDALEDAATRLDGEDRVSRKRIEARKEKLEARLLDLMAGKDDMLVISEMGADQIIVDEAQVYRKLSFSTACATLKGIDPDGSAIAWDLFVKVNFLRQSNPGRSLVMASGTPVTNTMGELYSLQRFMDPALLVERGVHEFDAWARCFGEAETKLELLPSGLYAPATRFAVFINVPELVAMFRVRADVIMQDKVRNVLNLPLIVGDKRQLVTAEPSREFRIYQRKLAQRIAAIQARKGPPKKGDDIILSVITDGRHSAIDMRLVGHLQDEPDNKLNKAIKNVYRIWKETADDIFIDPITGQQSEVRGAAQMIFSDIGTFGVEEKRGFSAYAWIRKRLTDLGIPWEQIRFMQDYETADAKQRLFADVNSGHVRVLVGSSQKMGTGTNAQRRMKALHHLDVPWLPSDIEQREGRIERQGNQNKTIEIYAYATLGSMDAAMWGANERKARFIAAALSGDHTIRRLEDVGAEAADQFAMAKAIASGDLRLRQKAGLEAEVGRLRRLRGAHFNGQIETRHQLADARSVVENCDKLIPRLEADIAQYVPARLASFSMEFGDRTIADRTSAGTAILLAKKEMEKAREVDAVRRVGSIGGFALVLHCRQGAWGFECRLFIDLASGQTKVDVPHGTDAAGVIAKVEMLLGNLSYDLERTIAAKATAQQRIEVYAPLVGQTFPLQWELDEKQAELTALDADLAESSKAQEKDAAA